MPTVLVTGGTGLVGTALTKLLLTRGYRVIILSRSPQTGSGAVHQQVQFAAWDVEQQTVDVSAIQQADHIIHLAGANVADNRWTAKRKKMIVESRTRGSELIVKSLKEFPNRVRSVISASATGWYGPDLPGKQAFEETSPPSPDFLGETCRQWEQSIDPVATLNIRLIKLRTGIALSREGGALPQLARPLRAGITTVLGSGKQVISWIHIEDLCRMYVDAMENENMNGVYNAVAPNPVSNKALMLELAKRMRGRFQVPIHIPGFILKIVLGEMSIEILKSTTVSADKIRETGFQFIFPTLESALSDLIKNNRNTAT